VKLLLTAGADAFSTGCIYGWCPLHAAAANGFTAIAAELLNHLRQQLKLERKDEKEEEEEIVEVLNRKTAEGWSPLYTAAKHGQEDLVAFLLQQKEVKVDQVDRAGLSALSAASSAGSSAVMRRLLRAGADVSLVDNNGNNILHCALSKPAKGMLFIHCFDNFIG